jgi:hypothetical protein
MFHTFLHLVHWVLDFFGVNNTYNGFSTRMYNFWSGFGANISLLAVSGAIVGVYRHNLNRLERINPINIARKLEEVEKEKQKERESNNNSDNPPKS